MALPESGRAGCTCVNVDCIPKRLCSYGAHFAESFEETRSQRWQLSGARTLDRDTLTPQVVGSTFVADTISSNATSSRMITLRVVDGDIVGTAHKSDNTVYTKKLPLGQKIDPSKNAWKEIRR